VTVEGVGRVSGEPDTLRVTLGVSVTRPSVDEALTVANERADAVLAGLREAGVAEKDIQTRDFALQPEYRHREDEPPQITGYTVRNLVEAKVRELARAGEVLTAAVEAGGDAARVESVGFFLEDNAELLRQAREAAFADARAKAEQYAELADRRLGALLSISETTNEAPPPVPFDAAAADEAARAAAPVPIEAGQSEVSVHVTAVWALE
jgi:uncharacterized protein YggE